MSTINPPVLLGDPRNQFRVDYIQDVASQQDFDYPSVSMHLLLFLTSSSLLVRHWQLFAVQKDDNNKYVAFIALQLGGTSGSFQYSAGI